jgi:hypothetical protein
VKNYIIAAAAIILFGFGAGTATARDTYVSGYTRSNGTYVAPYHRSAPNSTPYDNYSTRGNTNPYTGQAGTVNPYAAPNPYTQGQTRSPYSTR